MKLINGHASQDAEAVLFGVKSSDQLHVGKTKQRKIEILAVIDARNLERECFVRSLGRSHPRLTIVGYRSIGQMEEDTDIAPTLSTIIFNIGNREVSHRDVSAEIEYLVTAAQPTSVIVLAESEDLREMVAAIDCGARGYIPASVGIDVIIEAARLTSAGGIFLPITSILSLRNAIGPKLEPPSDLDEQFTPRQSAVAKALRRGKANKVIAYELNMSESTVKVHIRNIMRKLKVSNRTEAAFKLNVGPAGEERAAR